MISIWILINDVVVASVEFDLSRTYLDTKPISREFHLAHWLFLEHSNTMVVQALCKLAICISDASWSTSRSVEVPTDFVVLLFVRDC